MRNRKLCLILLLGLCVAFCLALFSCKEPVKHTVTYVLNNGAENVVVSVTEGETPSAMTPSRYGYDFIGWYEDAALTRSVNPAANPVSADVTYYAAWDAQSFIRITFDSRGGSAVDPVVIRKGESVDLSATPVPTKEGYTFSGWYGDIVSKTTYDVGSAPAADMTLYAGWRLNEGMGECVGMLGEREVARVAFPAGTPIVPTTDDGLSYVWYADAALTQPYDFTAAVSGSVTLFGVAYTDGLTIVNGAVTGYGGANANVTVPALWEGTPVTEIASYAFARQSAVKTVDLPATITTVGNHAFYGCTRLSSVNLTNGCTSLGAYAFYGCEKLVEVGDISSLTDIPDAAFLGCRRLTGVSLPDGLQSIGAYAFADCEALTSLRLGDGISTIGECAFSGCSSLTELHIPARLSSLGASAMKGCFALERLTYAEDNDTAFYRVIDGNLYGNSGKKLLLYVPCGKTETAFVLPAGATTVAAYAFYGNTNLTELTFDTSTYVLEKGALAGMQSLEKLTVYTLSGDADYLAYYFGAESAEANGSAGAYTPASLTTVVLTKQPTTLTEYAFYGCTGLSCIEGLSALRSVGAYAFAYTALQDVVIPASLSGIGENAFFGCSQIRSFTVESGNPAFVAYDGCLYNQKMTDLYIVPPTKTEITFPATLTNIASGAFYKSALTSVILPDSVKTIAAGAFSGVMRLTELSVPFIGGSRSENTYMIYIFGGSVNKSLQTDGTYRYSIGNTSSTPPTLKKLTVTGNVTEIPDFAFAYLTGVEEITVAGEITAIGAYAYNDTGLKELTLPNTLRSIGEYAFANMDSLVTATIPGSVGGNLGEGILYGCSDLEKVIFEEGVTLIPAVALYPTYSTNSTTGEYDFYSSLTSITVPASVETIGEMAFAYAGTMYMGDYGSTYGELDFILAKGSHLRTIEKKAFYRSSISSLALPACFADIGEMAFFGCRNLESVTFGNAQDGSQLATIGGAAFSYCTGLSEMTIYKEVTSAAVVPVIELYVASSTTETVSYNIFASASVPTIYVYGAEYYRTAENWDEYDTYIFSMKR